MRPLFLEEIMPTLYDLEDGDTFRWRDDIYELKSVSDDGKAQAKRIATRSGEGWHITGPNLDDNFNPYAEIEVGTLTTIWNPNK